MRIGNAAKQRHQNCHKVTGPLLSDSQISDITDIESHDPDLDHFAPMPPTHQKLSCYCTAGDHTYIFTKQTKRVISILKHI